MRGQWNRQRAIAVVLGGMAGAGLRWALLTTAPPGRFPWPVLAVNIAGSVLLGALLAQEPTHASLRTVLHDAGGIGFCGGLTTFSTFALEVVDLVRADDTVIAVTYASSSVAGAIAGVIAGATAFRNVRALTIPLDEQP
jgi:CrcB protein